MKNIEEIRDKKNKLVCTYNRHTGLLKNIYKRQKMEITLSEGSKVIFEKDGVKTEVLRLEKNEYDVRSEYC